MLKYGANRLIFRGFRAFCLVAMAFGAGGCQNFVNGKSKVGGGYLKTPQPLELAGPLQNDEIGAEAALFSGWCSLGTAFNVSYSGTFGAGNPTQVNCEPCTASESASCGSEQYARGKYRFRVNFAGAVGARTIELRALVKNKLEVVTRNVNYRPLALSAYLKPSHRKNSYNYFGRSVAISGDTAVVGNYGEGSGLTTPHQGATAPTITPGMVRKGSAFVFKFDGTVWAQEAILYPPYITDQNLQDFGYSVDISGDTVVVGAFRDSAPFTGVKQGAAIPTTPQLTTESGVVSLVNPHFGGGTAFVYKRTGSTWAIEAAMRAPNPGNSDSFGTSVAISGDSIVVGARDEDSADTTIINGATASSDNSAVDSGAAYIFERTGSTWRQTAFLKAPNAQAGDYFGFRADISGDTVVVSAHGEDSNQVTITNGATASSDNSALSSGAAYVFRKVAGTWQNEAYIKASNAEASDFFSYSLAIDGDAIVVGAYGEDSTLRTITNGPTSSADNTRATSGAVYVYRRTGASWAQEAYIKSVNSSGSDNFGGSVDISGDTIVSAAFGEDGDQLVITNGATIPTDNALRNGSGAVYVYKRTAGAWAQEAFLKTPNSDVSDAFGRYSIAVSGDWVIAPAPGDDSNATGVTNGSASADNSLGNAGSAHAFRRTGANWAYSAYFKPTHLDNTGYFGTFMVADGDTLAISARSDSGGDNTVINAATWNPATSVQNSGAVYVFRKTAGLWAQEAVLKAPNLDVDDYFGYHLAISGDTIAVGAYGEDSNQNSITNGAGASADNSADEAGAVYIFTRSGANWSQEAYIKASNAGAGDQFGIRVGLSGNTLVVGADGESSNQTTITNGAGASADNSASGAGAAYVFTRTGVNWAQTAYIKAPNSGAGDGFGEEIAISANGFIAVGAKYEDGSSTGVTNGLVLDDNLSVNSGAVYTFWLNAGNWDFSSYIKPTGSNLEYGNYPNNLSLHNNRLVAGGPYEALGSDLNRGAAYIYEAISGGWALEKKMNSPVARTIFYGTRTIVKGDYLLVGAAGEDYLAGGFTDGTIQSFGASSYFRSGAAFLYKKNNTTGEWQLRNYIKPSLMMNLSLFLGGAIGDDFVACSALYESNDQIGVTNGSTVTNSGVAPGVGAAYVYSLDP